MLSLNDVGVFLDNKWIFRHICITFGYPRIISIIGASGAGKSTLVRCMAGLCKPTEGSVNCVDRSTVVFQDYHLFNNMNVQQNIEYAANTNRIDTKNTDVIYKLKIDHLMHKSVYELSGGEKQRVAIARALSINPKIIFFDEPTAALDHNSVHSFKDIVSCIAKDILILIVTHDLSLASFCNVTYLLNNGQLEVQV